MYAKNVEPDFWYVERCTNVAVLSKIEEILQRNGGNYKLFLRMMEDYYDAKRCPPGDYGTGNPHREMEADAYDSAWRHFRESCNRFGLPSDEVQVTIYEC